ncbi:MAG: RidA family protein [bacterium]|nr:RidA family protein [Bacillota bacterium]HHW55242.1 RidA family protein [Bacillota bacterium]
MKKEAINTQRAPAPVGPYSQAVRAGNLLFLSGQIALDPATGQLVDGDVREHTKRIMENLKAVLEGAGATLDHVVKTTIFLTDMGDFAAVNEVYGSYFAAVPPARSCVQVAALPKGVPIEIEMIALLD